MNIICYILLFLFFYILFFTTWPADKSIQKTYLNYEGEVYYINYSWDKENNRRTIIYFSDGRYFDLLSFPEHPIKIGDYVRLQLLNDIEIVADKIIDRRIATI